MEAIIKKNGKVISGNLADVFVKIGIAEEIQDEIFETPDAWKTKTKAKKPGRPKNPSTKAVK